MSGLRFVRFAILGDMIKEIKRSQKPHNKRRRTKRVKARKLTKVGLKRVWGVPDNAYTRFSGLKGIYYYYFSRWIKQRDYAQFGGKCITCLQYVEPEQAQCGHIFAAKDCGFALLFHPLNNSLQHSKCNNPIFTPSASIMNCLNIEKRYGAGTIQRLADLKGIGSKEWSKSEYEIKIKEIQNGINS